MPQAARLERADLWIRASGSASTTSLPSLSKTNRTGRIPCIAKLDSIMQQLTLQFEGFADEMQQPADASAAKQQAAHAILDGASAVVNNCSLTGKKLFPNWEVNIPSLGITLTKADLPMMAFAAASVIGGFGLISFCALIQG